MTAAVREYIEVARASIQRAIAHSDADMTISRRLKGALGSLDSILNGPKPDHQKWGGKFD
jgi:hypothetical protein